MSKEQENAKKWGQIVAKCWQDEAFKAKFIADPVAVLKEYGIDAPAGFKVVENSSEEVYFILPQKPADLSDEQLNDVSGGYYFPSIPDCPC
jgi:hypothetical protein